MPGGLRAHSRPSAGPPCLRPCALLRDTRVCCSPAVWGRAAHVFKCACDSGPVARRLSGSHTGPTSVCVRVNVCVYERAHAGFRACLATVRGHGEMPARPQPLAFRTHKLRDERKLGRLHRPSPGPAVRGL